MKFTISITALLVMTQIANYSLDIKQLDVVATHNRSLKQHDVKKGYMKKTNSKGKYPKKRYIRLMDTGVINYYVTPKYNSLKGSIDLLDIPVWSNVVVEKKSLDEGYDYCVSFRTSTKSKGNRDWQFYTGSEQEANDWRDEIEKVRKEKGVQHARKFFENEGFTNGNIQIFSISFSPSGKNRICTLYAESSDGETTESTVVVPRNPNWHPWIQEIETSDAWDKYKTVPNANVLSYTYKRKPRIATVHTA